MKTQRPRENSTRRPAPDGDGDRGKTVARREGEPVAGAGQQGAGRQSPPALPPRKPKPAASATPVAAPVSAPVVAQLEAHNGSPSPVARYIAPVFRAAMTYETALWIGFFALAFITRFWDLGPRALHHDESLHAVYSRNLYSGVGYTHDPMMHGPLQFHFIALMYWLFGAADATARYASALCSVFVVMSPLFLRRQLGRLTALVASFLLLVSPSILYFGRMAREDSIYSGMEMIMIVGLWRFVSTRKPADFYIFCAGLSLMFTIKESAYLTVAVLGVFFLLLFAYQAGYAILGALAGWLALMGGAFLYLSGQMKSGAIPKLPNIPVTSPDYDTIAAFAGAFLTHPLVLTMLLLGIAFVGALLFLFLNKARQIKASTPDRRTVTVPSRRVRLTSHVRDTTVAAAHTGSAGAAPTDGHPPTADSTAVASTAADEVTEHEHHGIPVVVSEDASPTWDPRALSPRRGGVMAHYEQGSLPYLTGSLWARPMVLLIGFIIAATIFVTLYTVFFTDVPRGIVSGLFGSLGYWIAQQDVARGGQPWFYYLLLIPLYEPIAYFFAAVSTIFFAVKGISWLRRNREEMYEDDRPGLGLYNTDRQVPFARFGAFLPLFLIWWLLGVLAIYSWAGEKMPWLMIHMVRPAIFLVALFVGAVLASMIQRRRERLEDAGLLDDEYDADDRVVDTGSRRLAGAMRYELARFGAVARSYGLLAPRLALETASRDVVAFASSRGHRSPGVPRRRGGAAPPVAARAVVQRPVYYVQEPPWEAWNRPGSVFPFASYLVVFMLLALAWGLMMSQQMYDAAHGGSYNNWGITWVYPFLMLVLTVSYAIWIGPGRALRYLVVGALSVLLLYQVRSSIALSYNHPDTATELAVYVQTSPDVTRAVKELADFSRATTGGLDVKVVYDSEVSWPMEWYLGNYKNKQFIGGNAPTDAEAPVMFLGYNRLTDQNILKNYVPQRYALRWWFPEEWYKNEFLLDQFQKDANGGIINDPVTQQAKENPPWVQVGSALQTVARTVTMPELQAELWNYLAYRETPKPLGSTDFVLFLRKDVAQYWHRLQYEPPPLTNVP